MSFHPVSAHPYFFFFFFFNDTATTEIYTLSLHDALPISYLSGLGRRRLVPRLQLGTQWITCITTCGDPLSPKLQAWNQRSEEHTSELQSQSNIVCRLLLEKKKKEILTSNCSVHGECAWMT